MPWLVIVYLNIIITVLTLIKRFMHIQLKVELVQPSFSMQSCDFKLLQPFLNLWTF